MTKGSQEEKDSYNKYLEEKHNQFQIPEATLNKAVFEAVGSNIIHKQKIIKGEINEVYEIVTTQDQKVVARVSRNEDNGFLAEQWALQKCQDLAIPVPKILGIQQFEVDHSPLYVCIQEFLEGDTLERGNIDFKKLDKKLFRNLIAQAGEILSKIHSIKTENVGWLGPKGQGIFPTNEDRFLNFQKKSEEFSKTVKVVGLPSNTVDRVMEIVNSNLPLYDQFNWVLNHGDYGPKHLMVRDNKIVGILDFGGVCSEPGVYDFFWWDYWSGKDIPLDWLKEGYQDKKLFNDSFDRLLKVMRVYRGLELLAWYQTEKFIPAVNKAKQKLLKDLKAF